jgi:hypothetical protein
MPTDFITEAYLCTNPYCLIGHWVVTQAQEQIWRIVAEFDNFPFLVSGATPICPCCASQLLTPLAMEEGFSDATEQEQGPLFDFIRTLS